MPYIGNTIRAADDYRLIDDISSGFNGSTTSFALQVAGSAPVPFPKSPQQVLISVNGVIQEPDPTGASGFNLVGTNIVFSSAPTNGHAFFGIIYATADYLNAGGNFPSGSLGAPSITFIGDENSGLYRKSGGSVGFVSDATEIANFDSNGITISSGNIIIPDSIIHNGDTNTKIRFPAADTITAETGGSERVRVDSSGNVGIATTSGGGKLAILSNSSTYEGLELQTPSGDGSGEFHIGVHQSGATSGRTIVFKRGGADGMDSESMRIDNSGNVGIGATSPSAKLEIQTAAGERVQFLSNGSNQQPRIDLTRDSGIDFSIINAIGSYQLKKATNKIYEYASDTHRFSIDGTEKARMDSSGRLLVGTSNTLPAFGASSALQVAGTGFSSGSILIRRDGDNAFSGALVFGKSRGSLGGNTIVQDDDQIGAIIWTAADGTDLTTDLAQIKARIDGTPGSNDMPGRMEFHTTADGASGVSERMRIDSSGRVGIGTTSTAYKLEVVDASVLLKLNSSNEGNYDVRFVYQNSEANIWSYSSKDLTFGTRFAKKLHLVTNGPSKRVTIDDGGRVGIGTTSPAVTFNVVTTGTDAALFESTSGDANGVQLSLRATSASPADNDVLAVLDFSGRDDGNNNTTYAQIRSHSRDVSDGSEDGDITFHTRHNGTFDERVRINQSGNVGIGTTHIEAPLSVFRDVAASASFNLDNNTMMLRNSGSNSTANRTSLYFRTHAADNKLSPSGIRCISGTNYQSILAFHTNGNGNGTGHIESYERMRIDGSGNVGIGGTAPNYQLHVVSSIGIGSHGFAQQLSISNQRIQSLLLGTGYTTLILNGLGGDIVMGSGSTQRLAFGTNDGVKYSGFGPAHGAAQDVGLNFYTTTNAGTTFVNHFRIDHNGDLFGTDTSISSISDSRVKTNITNYTYDLTKFKQFTPKQFDWKNPEYHGEKTNLKGFLAQDLEAIDTQWVGSSFIQKDNPDYDLVDKSKNGEDEDVGVAKTSKFGDKDAMYISVINQMITKIETLETKVAALESA